MDFDGTLSDGKVYVDKDGNETRTSYCKDGYIIKKNKDLFYFGIISGADINFFKKRANFLGFKYIIDKVPLNKSKLESVEEILAELNLTIDNLAYIGDDLNDLEIIQKTFSACPINSPKEIKESASFICKSKGGEGCVREFIEYIIDNSNNG